MPEGTRLAKPDRSAPGLGQIPENSTVGSHGPIRLLASKSAFSPIFHHLLWTLFYIVDFFISDLIKPFHADLSVCCEWLQYSFKNLKKNYEFYSLHQIVFPQSRYKDSLKGALIYPWVLNIILPPSPLPSLLCSGPWEAKPFELHQRMPCTLCIGFSPKEVQTGGDGVRGTWGWLLSCLRFSPRALVWTAAFFQISWTWK